MPKFEIIDFRINMPRKSLDVYSQWRRRRHPHWIHNAIRVMPKDEIIDIVSPTER